MPQRKQAKTGRSAGLLFEPDTEPAELVMHAPPAPNCPSRNRGAEGRSRPYEGFYAALRGLREDFHRIGRFDDANAKLDELCKLLVLRVMDQRHPLAGEGSRLSRRHLEQTAAASFGDTRRLAGALHEIYNDLTKRFPAEFAAFGVRSALNLQPDDDDFASAIIPVLSNLPDIGSTETDRWIFDSLNEAFGHFVQDSFRNRKEDAQYMTPPEVVSAVVDIVIADLVTEQECHANRRLLIADPTCGVGSFLAAFRMHARQVRWLSGPLADVIDLYGQDKVERMVRLAGVNLQVFANATANIQLGNSILSPSALDGIAGKTDVILTNPPFGATFDTRELLSQADAWRLPTLADLSRSRELPQTLDSEYILLDRELALLRPGGRLLMVVPDHVVSGSGFSETFRIAMLRRADLVAVIDLPTETFAQAGTRTKTSVVYLRRRHPGESPTDKPVFMATSSDLGFRVVSRTGASVKKITGTCDLEHVVECYRDFRRGHCPAGDIVCLSDTPSVAAVSPHRMLNNRWTAGFYRTDRLAALQQLESLASECDAAPLCEVARIDPNGRERVLRNEANRCISVLHLSENGCIDLHAVDSYEPTTPCVRCAEQDVLLSKINPRIMRVAIVPRTKWKLGCSTEFAIMRPKCAAICAWALALLLRTNVVQSQIRSLTSGTSSSHNRIKDRDLASVLIPVPREGTGAAKRLAEAADRYRQACDTYYHALLQMLQSQEECEQILNCENPQN